MSMVVIVGGVKVELLHHTTAALLGDKVGIIKCSARLSHFRYSSILVILRYIRLRWKWNWMMPTSLLKNLLSHFSVMDSVLAR
jgi:hypothetical protein